MTCGITVYLWEKFKSWGSEYCRRKSTGFPGWVLKREKFLVVLHKKCDLLPSQQSRRFHFGSSAIQGLDFHYKFAHDLKKLTENINSQFKYIFELSRTAVHYLRCYTFPLALKKKKGSWKAAESESFNWSYEQCNYFSSQNIWESAEVWYFYICTHSDRCTHTYTYI